MLFRSTCLLTEEEKIKMCELVTNAGAEYIKTSTGFSTAGATFDDVKLMHDHVGEGVKVKAAGGISSFDDAVILNDHDSMTYDYYFKNVKPKPEKKKKGWVCKICGWVYEGDELPEDLICPICKHPASDFEPL